MKPQGILIVLVVCAVAAASSAFAIDKLDYSQATDKWVQSNEPHWNPRAGLRLLANVPEVEPNDACPGQGINCGDVLTQASLTQGDVDYISFQATQGDVCVLGTDSAGGLDPDTKLTLLDNCGAVLATDDDSGPGLFSLLGYTIPSTGTYVLKIEGLHGAVAGDYIAFISCAPGDPSEICATAPPLPCGYFSINGTTVGRNDDYDLTDGQQNECTGFATAGSDVVYVIDQPEFSLNVTYTSTVDGALYLVTDCNNPRGSCVAGSDLTVEGEPETLRFTATTAEPGPYYLILDNFVGDEGPAGDFTLTGYLDCPPFRWVNQLGFSNGGLGLGAAWGDYNGDGSDDIYLSKYGEANRLLTGPGLNAVSNPLLNDMGNGRGTAWADYDNDGDLDLYLANGLSANKLFVNEGGGSFSEVTGSPVNDAGDGRGVAWVDFDNDGHVDLYLANAYSPNKLFKNDGFGGFTDVTAPPLDDPGDAGGVAWADYDNDGDQDLYVANYGQSNKLFQNNGDGTFTDVTTFPLDDAGNSRGVAWGDYDNDGDLDLYLSNALSANKLFRNNGDGSFTDVTTGLLGDTGEGRGVEWADYDNDGDLDLYLANAFSANKLFENDGAGAFIDAATAALADPNSGQAVASADYDGDGDLDIYVVNTLTFDKLFKNDLPAGNHWLHIDLQGALSNRSGIGARVRVAANGISQIREVSGGSGYLAQGSLTLEFGLGAATVTDTVEVFWPSGTRQIFLGLVADQKVLLDETMSTDAEEVSIPKRFRLLGNVPDPFNPSTEIRYVLPGASNVRITIYDARGRAVRHLRTGTQGPGLQAVRWDGTDDNGIGLASGAYVARVTSDYGSDSEKLTLLK